jgi:hypothetical protein
MVMEDGQVRVVDTEDKEEEKLVNSKMKIVIELERTFDPKRTRNDLMMTMGAAEFADPVTDEKVGEVLHGVPAHSVIRDKTTKEDWVLNYADLFTAYIRARAEFEKPEEK